MKFSYRLAYYLGGLLLGIVFVVFFLQAKADARDVSFCYFPNCRVLQDLRKKSFEISPKADSIFQQKWVNLEDVKKCMEFGDVDFAKSNKPVKGGKIYFIEGKNTKGEPITVTMINYENKVVLTDIKKD
ncbi:DUF4258 domain-containing protein [Flavobacterium macacae]|uniref:DUF4258 domain-containing protein n=1 Tax=Flavobacterium macacae TaxID=2488993 RepID=A0A3P3WDY1_9FLAO|nr:DUF4258 domain-containing protein [Flavobacterium macacae]RRJ93361.1 DUF4258 domain-containing protein [Flavobacterium macacae]